MLQFRPAGRVPFGSRPKRNQKGLPRHPALRFAPGSFAPSSFQGHASKGHPWPIVALAASMPLNPFHDDSTHPPEGAFGAACMSLVADGPHAPRGNDQRAMRVAPRKTTKHLGARVPVRRPSGGVAQGDEPHGCGERTRRPRLKGHGRPLCAGPRSGAGGREVWRRSRQTRMSGCAFFCLLFFVPGGDPQTKKSEAP